MPSEKFIIIAIDGGAASGKSTTARAVSERLNYLYVDTGTHYRMVTYLMIRDGITPNDSTTVKAYLKDRPLETKVDKHREIMFIDAGHPDESDLRSAEVNNQVSRFAALKPVRQFLFNYQRNLAKVAQELGFAGIIMEGRDIGSIIFPHADYKIFLEANPLTRAERRALDGQKDAITQRDQLDSERNTAPLICPQGAIRIDTSQIPLEAVVEKICAIIVEGSESDN